MHFTYKDPDKNKLKQGDLLKKTPGLLKLLEEIHPTYAESEYLYFQVLTQTCDLVMRKGSCKSRYITLAAVRSFDLVVKRAIEKFSDHATFNNQVFCSEIHKKSLEDVINKLLNNNDTQHFYLEAEGELPLRCCTHLHLSISLRAYEHYDLCLDAKILELEQPFQAKLGWLVGNLYSRVATEDYADGALLDENNYDIFKNGIMNSYVAWIPASDFSLFRKQIKTNTDLDVVTANIDSERARSRETRLDQIVEAIAKPLELDAEKKELVKNVLNLHPLIKPILK